MLELLIFHITVALSGVALSSYSFFRPDLLKIRLTYILVGMTLISGSWLVVVTHAPILSGCLSGLAYVGIALVGLVPARHKLARQTRQM